MLLKNIQNKIILEDKESEIILSFFKPLTIGKKSDLLLGNEYNNKLFFVEKGLLYTYKTIENGDEQVIQFAKEDGWITDLYSYFTDSKSLFGIRTLEDCDLWYINKNDFKKLCDLVPKMERFSLITFQMAYTSSLLRIAQIYSSDTTAKYEYFKDKFPDLIQRVPQYLIASYLGVLPSSLSRIRNKK